MEEIKLKWSANIDQIATALAKFQGSVPAIPKAKTANIPTKSGGSFKYSYADLGAILDYTAKTRAENGLAISSGFSETDGTNKMYTLLLHSSGQWLYSELKLNCLPEKCQELGSLITYLRRYMTCSALGICPEDDDDGESAQAKYQSKPAAKAVTAKPIVQKKETIEQKPTTASQESLPNIPKPPPIPHVTPEQAKELEALLDKTPQAFKDDMLKFLKERKWNDFLVPISNFASIKAHFEKNIINETAGANV